jgi:hypothetical protein
VDGVIRLPLGPETRWSFPRTLVDGVQQGDPTGPLYRLTWDTRDAAGQLVLPNTSFRIVVSADRANPSTLLPHLANANSKETAVVVSGSQHRSSPDRKLEFVFRPDDAKMDIRSFPVLSVKAGRLLTARGLKPLGGCYEVRVDRPLDGPVVGILKYPSADGYLLRPFCWDKTQEDWLAVGRTNWNPTTRQLSFALPAAGTILFAATSDVGMPWIAKSTVTGSTFEVHARDDGTDIDPAKTRLRQGGVDLSKRLAVRSQNGLREVVLTLPGFDAAAGAAELYLEDWVGNGRLFIMNMKEAAGP